MQTQHGVITRGQLLCFGFSGEAIDHRLRIGRLHRIWRGVYSVGRPELTQRGPWMAAVLVSGPGAALSHGSGAAHLGIRPASRGRIEVSVPVGRRGQRREILVHRRTAFGPEQVIQHDGIPVTSPVLTLVDIAPRLSRAELDRAINEADKRGLTCPERLRAALDRTSPRPGMAVLREMLDRQTFHLTDSELERRFLPLARAAGLPPPVTQAYVNGFRVDFYWPDLGLVVETDGLRYHRTAAEQANDRLRDQAHTAAGLTQLRFTHAQVRYEPGHVRATLAAVSSRLGAAAG